MAAVKRTHRRARRWQQLGKLWRRVNQILEHGKTDERCERLYAELREIGFGPMGGGGYDG